MDDVIYAIIDKAAENSASSEPAEDSPKRKRTRIVKKDSNHVYSVKGKDGENLDAKNKRIPKKTESPSLFSDAPFVADRDTPCYHTDLHAIAGQLTV